MTDYPFFFTWTAQRDAHPLEIQSGSGAHFETSDGAKWVDLGSMSFHANLGHGHPRMIEAIQSQAERLCVVSATTVYPEKIELAQRLLEIAPEGYSKVFFTLGGAEATENALKMARMFTGRHKLVSRYRSYHGATMGALTLTGDYRRAPLEPGITGVTHFYDEYLDALTEDRDPGPATTQLDRILTHEGGVAAVVLETIPGANGVRMGDDAYWRSVEAACKKHDALLIIDEVLVGFGRTGKWLALEHYGIQPDLITVAKGITGGYAPLGAVLVHERIARYFEDHVLYGGLTQYAHPLATAAALEAIKIYEEENLFANALDLEPVLLEGLRDCAAAAGDAARDVRGKGLLAALELTLPPDGWSAFKKKLHERHVHAHVRTQSDCLILAPPLCIDESALRAGLAEIRATLEEVT